METDAVVLAGRLESSESAQSQLRFGGLSWLSASSGQQRPPSFAEDADAHTARCEALCVANGPHPGSSQVLPCWRPPTAAAAAKSVLRHHTEFVSIARRL